MNIKASIAAALLLSSVAGCAVLIPNDVRIEGEHLSHITQHEPFTSHPSEDASELLSVLGHWDIGSHGYLEIGDGINLAPSSRPDPTYAHGNLIGPREEFSARLGYRIPLRPR